MANAFQSTQLRVPSYPRPNDRAGTLGVGTVKAKPAAAKAPGSSAGRTSGYTASQVAASLAANPLASSGGYGVGGAGNQAVGGAMMTDAGGNAIDPYNYTDPILQKIQALSTAARTNAQSDALALRKQLAISYGDVSGIPGLEGDTSTAASAKGNPFSILTELQRQYDRTVAADEENLNSQGLFYSGARAKQLGLDAEDFQRQKAAALGTLQGRLGEVNTNLAQALSAADQQDIQGQTDAAGRATSRALNYGYDPGASSPVSTAPAVSLPQPQDSLASALAPPTAAESPGAAPSRSAPGNLAYTLGQAHRRRNPYDLARENG